MTPTLKGYVFIGVSENWTRIFRVTLVETLALDSPLVAIQIYHYHLVALFISLAEKKGHTVHTSVQKFGMSLMRPSGKFNLSLRC